MPLTCKTRNIGASSTHSRRARWTWFALLMGWLLLIGSATPCLAANAKPAGLVAVAVGAVHARDANGAKRALKRRSPVYEGETVTTGEGARAQLRFRDGAVVSLRAESALRIDSYRFENHGGKGDHSFMTLVKGGLRTVTGAIGKTDPDSYKMSTDLATIGIRGTHYELFRGDGLSVALWEGRISVRNQAGFIHLGDDASYRFAYVKSADTPPRGRVQPPPGIGDEQFQPLSGVWPRLDGAVNGVDDGSGSTGDDGTNGAKGDERINDPANQDAGTDRFRPFDPSQNVPTAPPPPAGDQRLSATEEQALAGSEVGFLAIGQKAPGIDVTTPSNRTFAGKAAPDEQSTGPLFADWGNGLDATTVNQGAPAHVFRQGAAPGQNATTLGTGTSWTTAYVQSQHPNVDWGTWNANSSQPAQAYTDPTDAAVSTDISSPAYWITAQQTQMGNLVTSGTGSYSQLFVLQGSSNGSPLDTSTSYIGIDVNFATAQVTSGSFSVNDANGGQWGMTVGTGDMSSYTLQLNASGTFTAGSNTETATGQVNAAIVGSNGAGMAGSFDFNGSGGSWANGVFLLHEVCNATGNPC